MLRPKINEITSGGFDHIENEEEKKKDMNAIYPLAFDEGWRDILFDSDNEEGGMCGRMGWPSDFNEIETLRILLRPLYNQAIRAWLTADSLNSEDMEEKLNEIFNELPNNIKDKIYESLQRWLGSVDKTKSKEYLWKQFTETFNYFFKDNYLKYEADVQETVAYKKICGEQLYKLHINLPISINQTWSEDAARKIYPLLKNAVEEGVLRSAKALHGLSFANFILADEFKKSNPRFLDYSQFTLYLCDPLDINKVKQLILNINKIAAEEGVYHNKHEEKCDTHIAGIVSLRYDYYKDKYVAASKVDPSHLKEQAALPIIKQLEDKKIDVRCEQIQKEALNQCRENSQLLINFYKKIKSDMTKDSLLADKGKVYNEFETLLKNDMIKKSEMELYFKLLIKIILQRNKNGFSITTSSGKKALQLLSTEEFSNLRKLISPEKVLTYDHLLMFSTNESILNPAFFSSKNKALRLKEFKEEVQKYNKKYGALK